MDNPITSEQRRVLFSVKQKIFPHLKPKNPPPSQLPLPLSVEPRLESRDILSASRHLAATPSRARLRTASRDRAAAETRGKPRNRGKTRPWVGLVSSEGPPVGQKSRRRAWTWV